MQDMKKFQSSSGPPSRSSMKMAQLAIESNLAEMKIIVEETSDQKSSPLCGDKYRLLYMGSCFYDYYLLAEDCLLHIAKLTDKWVPASLDWHERLLNLMQSPVPDRRPPVLSPETAYLLSDYLCLYLNFHQHSSRLSFVRIEKMVKNLRLLHYQFEKEVARINKLFTL